MARDLRGCRVLITGASRGIGRCLAEKLAPLGVKLSLVARGETALGELADKLSSSGAMAYSIPADIADQDQRESLVRTAVEKMGGLDVLVNNAGVASWGHFDSSSEAVLRTIMEVNFFAPAELMRLAAPHLMRGRQPAVVNVASVCGRRGLPGWPEHSASKFALVGLSDVLVALPGLVRSEDLGRHLLRSEGRYPLDFEKAQPPEQVADAILKSLQRNRAETAIGWQSKWLLRANRFIPRLVDRMLARKVRQLYG